MIRCRNLRSICYGADRYAHSALDIQRSGRLTPGARDAISGNDVCVSIASLWEIAIKASLKREDKRLELKETIQTIAETCEAQGIDIVPITPGDCQRVRMLPHHHEDPFDRLIMAQAIEMGVPLITKDENIWKYKEVEKIW